MTVFGNHIPGETPIDDVSGLKIPGITKRTELNEFEAASIASVVAKYLSGHLTRRRAKFTYEWCLRLHKEMFGDVWVWAGIPRGYNLNIGVAYYSVPDNVARLLDDLTHWSAFGIDFVEQATRLHHRAVQIHPFVNGNGRWSRMLANIWLKLHNQPLILWPEQTIGTESTVRSQYLAAILKADDGEYDDLIAMHREFADRKA